MLKFIQMVSLWRTRLFVGALVIAVFLGVIGLMIEGITSLLT